MKKKIISIVGARPHFIKAAPLSRTFVNNDVLEEILLHTGQHHDANMSDVFFSELGIPTPKYNLNINGGTHGQMTGRMISDIEEVLINEKPGAVIVYGDTNSTLAGALAAIKLHIQVFHVEAGLRSFNMRMPEEINRILSDRVSTLLFCPTYESKRNLENEGITKGVHHTGDVMYDAMLFAKEMLENDVLEIDNFDVQNRDYAILTIHRAESTENLHSLINILRYTIDFSIEHNLKIVFPIHPRTRKVLGDATLIEHENLLLIEPISYFSMQAALAKAKYVLTDSGGVQKEAYFHRVPCITLRSETEWLETISAGWNRLWTVDAYKPRTEITDYGTGKAAQEISRLITEQVL